MDIFQNATIGDLFLIQSLLLGAANIPQIPHSLS